jgi:iron complex transport system permease protein
MDAATAKSEYDAHVRGQLLFVGATAIAILLAAVYALVSGPISIPVARLGTILTGQADGTNARVVWHIRLPRIVAAIGAGAALAVAGTVLQSVLRNPLASPYTLGISQGAAFGAAVAIVLLDDNAAANDGFRVLLNNLYLTSASAFVFAMMSAFVILVVARYRRASPETLVLTGIALASLFTAGTTVLEYVATNVELATLVYWKFGDVGGSTWRANVFLVGVLLAVMAYFTWKAWDYNLLDAGDETAKSLGVDVERTRLLGTVVAAFATAVTVSLFGIIGFVGLVVPHIVRRVIGGDEQFLIPASCLAGALLLLVADTLARTLFVPLVFPVGILTSFIGAPLFIYLILEGRSYW